MPFLSPSGSPSTSPKNRSISKFKGPAPPTSNHQEEHRYVGSPNITYIPPLIDGACGTTPNSRRSVVQQLRNDVSLLISLLPSLIHGALISRMNVFEMVQHVGLALLELYMLISAIPLWLTLPGALFAAWVGCCSALIVGMSWSLNGRGIRGEVIRSPSPAAADGWMMGQEVDDEQWLFIGGLGMSSRTLTKNTLPALARLFSRTVSAVHEPTYGLPIDICSALLKRSLNMNFPSAATHTLYTQIRTTLLDAKTSRTVVLAHNVGAITMSQILRQLYADVPTERLSKLEIYTFGAAAVEFVTPLGGPIAETKTIGKQVHAPEFVTERRGPHIEHFAFRNDPFALMGVIQSVHEDLAGRFCGSVFKLNNSGTDRTDASASAKDKHEAAMRTEAKPSSRPLMSLKDYMSCLFPDQTQSHNSSASSSTDRSILDDLMTIDRELAEKREFTALASDSASHIVKKGKKRLSWTGLGATANGMDRNMDGVVGLEMARKGCKDCTGHRGREVSRLVKYVCIPSQFDDNMERKA
ncbi:hypothetical protein N0V93_002742 [Gnomoniopsis smithogilvyi]|uniref:Uncharacterized protein n=1 Tax=Gnomoniopsis smithogilvyi TaxID=1191159 RepID=A0A9W8YZE5_9PEZI|nr:hypothetical protein N0V93_002742 [Gnomoniopsis smithogilvyi]